jgi:hypothetical protein
MTEAVPCGKWQVQERRVYEDRDETEFTLSRIYEFTDARSPATVSTLKIESHVSISLMGELHAYLDFELRPHIYLGLGQLPLPDDGMIRAPFSVWLLSGGGEGTEASPFFEGGACEVFWYSSGDEEPDDPEMALLRVISMQDEIQCLKVLGCGRQMTFTIMRDSEPWKLQLELPNDREFRRIYSDICDRLKRQHANRFSQPASSNDGLLGFFRRLFN